MDIDIDIFVNYIGLPSGGNSTVHIFHTNNTQKNTMKQNIQNRTYITIRTHKRNNKIT